MGIVSHVRPGTRQVVIFAAKLLDVQTLNCFIIHAADRVAVREDFVSVGIGVDFQNGSFTKAAYSQEQSTARNFRIRFGPSESSQEGHAELWIAE
jgi:hypothetical protein